MSTKYEILRTYRWRHASSLIVSRTQAIHWKSKPSKLNIWFLVYYHHAPGYNIEVRTWHNDDHATLKQLVDLAHNTFEVDQNHQFQRQRYQTYKHKEVMHIIALEPIT